LESLEAVCEVDVVINVEVEFTIGSEEVIIGGERERSTFG
jgi:hypothetical protein